MKLRTSRGTAVAAVAAATLLAAPMTASAASSTGIDVDLLFQDGTAYGFPLTGRVLLGDVDSGAGEPDDADAPVLYDGQGGWLLSDASGERAVSFGRGGDAPVLGDWDGDGKDEIGVVRGNVYFLAGENVDGGGDIRTVAFGRTSDRTRVLVGDWDGDGADEPAVLRQAGKTVSFSFAGATVDGGGDVVTQRWGRAATDLFFVADLDGDGTDSLVLQRQAAAQGGPGRAPYFYVSDGSPRDGLRADELVRYGRPADVGVAGDVDGDGTDELGVARLTFDADGSRAAGVKGTAQALGYPAL